MLLVANRGEIALRIIDTARDLGIDTVAVYAVDDADSPHVHAATTAVALAESGPAAYLDHGAIVSAATQAGAELVHPGYGFLSESAEFAEACAAAGLTFVGPSPTVLRLFGDKAAAREAAVAAAVPVLAATAADASLEQVREFFGEHSSGIMIKALAGGGGRGMRVVRDPADLDAAYSACAGEALHGFGRSELFAEALCDNARHIEVQIVSAASGATKTAVAIGDRDCSVQRRQQKLIEIAPAQGLSDDRRHELHASAARLCASVGYVGIGTVEFLVTVEGFVFLEVNPRIQVEHTITEEVTGIDLVAVQLALARGADFAGLALPQGVRATSADAAVPVVAGTCAASVGIAVQTRVNTETMTPDGDAIPSTGRLTAFSPPTGPGVRVDTYGRPNLVLSARYDSLLAKVITHNREPNLPAAIRKAHNALANFAIGGVATNIAFLRAILSDNEFGEGPVATTWLGHRIADFALPASTRQVGGRAVELHAGEELLRAHLVGTVVETAREGDDVPAGAPVVVLEAMKMQHVVLAQGDSRVVRILTAPGSTVGPGDALAVVRGVDTVASDAEAALDIDHVRDDLAEILDRHERTLDAARPAAVAKVHGRGRRTARENVADLVDEGTFVEYGALVLAAQRSRRSEDDLIANTAADGLVGGIAQIGGAEAVVMSYDYMVLAGTQGARNHAKTDRLLDLTARRRVPLVLFAEGGGGRPGDTDAGAAFGLDLDTFRSLAALNGKVPTVAVVSGRCFAGNAALAGACDVLIATPDANIGMGGPAMIDGGGLGVFRPEDIGPIDVQRANGVVHLAARDDEHAVDLAKRYLSYFQPSATEWTAPDERTARHVVPENRLRAYDVRTAIESIADIGSVLELRSDYGVGVVTALIRVEGLPYAVLANSSHHLGGAIDAEAADKAADFLTMCEAHRLPVVSLCDTPGFMVGPDSEEDATVRRFGRFFVAGARLTVPFGMIILRKAYGLGAMAMAAGSFHAPDFTIAWPTGEIGPMGLEGAVRLGFRKELDAAADPAAREKLFDQLVAMAYQHGKALTAATTFELDDVIDPGASRQWIRRLGTR
ncbi:carboxyl transferase domain-containing protein [Antrihabitans sp. NCIMB 15449]|uniref:acetyl-CoA carboxylase n=1 Tax=Antrihabitans spumae TaxID=3373370 RepID=A0ABW7JP20_9NOCA